MSRSHRSVLHRAWFLVALGVWGPSVADDAVVGDGSPASCTESALDDALFLVELGSVSGGTLSFACGSADVTIPITTPKFVGSERNVVIDGGGRVTLDANDATRPLEVLGAVVELRDIIVLNGNAGAGSGGAIRVNGGATLQLTRVLIRSSVAGERGGAIDALAGSTLRLAASTILANDAPLGGGIAAAGVLEIDDGLVALNTATATEGGGVFATGNTTIRRTRVENNGANDGGGFMQRGGTATILDARFTDNTATANGAGGMITANAVGTIERTVFERNLAVHGGGGLRVGEGESQALSARVTVRDSRFSDNEALEGGGAQAVGPGNSAIDALRFDRCELSSNRATRGGGLHQRATTRGQDLLVRANTATDGGGVWARGRFEIGASRIVGNSATQMGGGVFMDELIGIGGNSTFEANGAREGGAIAAATASSFSCDSCSFHGNGATHLGGAIRLSAVTGAQFGVAVTVENTTFSQNRVEGGLNPRGGDVYLRGAGDSRTVVPALFRSRHGTLLDAIGNEGSSMYLDYGARLELANTIIWPLIGTACGMVPLMGESIQDPDIDSFNGNIGPAGCGLDQANDFVAASRAAIGLGPRANNGSAMPTYLPDLGSIAIDRVQCALATTDQRGAPRPIDANGDGVALCDSGAIERQLVEPPVQGASLFRDGFEGA
jgi:predicted outer membrane repeat protein